MASQQKFTDGAVVNELRHNNRLIKKDKNTDIDPARTHLNYSLTPDIADRIPQEEYASRREEIRKAEYERYKKRKSECYVYGRKDVKTLVGGIVTCPKEITEKEDQDIFFKTVAAFLEDRYGRDNIISLTVHYDEGKSVPRTNENGEIIKDENGDTITDFIVGQPHLHFTYIPVKKINHAALEKKKKHCKEMDQYDFKISAKDVLNKHELQTFHPDLQKYLDQHGVKGRIMTKPLNGGKNVYLSVSKMKEITKLTGFVFEKPLNETIQSLISQNSKSQSLITALQESLKQSESKNQENQKKISELEKALHDLAVKLEESQSREEQISKQNNAWGSNRSIPQGWGSRPGWGQHSVDQDQNLNNEEVHNW